MNKSNKQSIPVIDLSPLYQSNSQAMDTLVQQVYDAYSRIGFAYITVSYTHLTLPTSDLV